MHIILWPFMSMWWLIFPLGWMVACLVRMVMRDNYDRERLRILKSYADQGKDVPESLRRELYR
ncbi:MAG: hypothetical protein WDN06_01600 [Asticcacaulis sp.]